MCNSKNRPTPVIKAGLWLLGLGVGGGVLNGAGGHFVILKNFYILIIVVATQLHKTIEIPSAGYFLMVRQNQSPFRCHIKNPGLENTMAGPTLRVLARSWSRSRSRSAFLTFLC